jgi:hypothetical protein
VSIVHQPRIDLGSDLFRFVLTDNMLRVRSSLTKVNENMSANQDGKLDIYFSYDVYKREFGNL